MKKILLTILAAAAFGAVHAATLSPAEALARLQDAQAAESTGSMRKAPANLLKATRLVATELMPSTSAPAVYLFAGRNDKGFVLVSADDCTDALLGYSNTATVTSEEQMAPALRWWLQEYARQIEYQSAMAGSDAVPTRFVPPSRTEKEAVAPLLSTQWDQAGPYNYMCPKYGAEETYTGCVATAMAQVMKYWEYPQCGKGKITYDSDDIQKRLSLDFSLRDFDWANMLDTYVEGSYNDAQRDAVAYLMKAAGYAVKMQYGVDASAALAMYIRKGLVKYFNYDGNTRYTLRQYHTTSEWEDLIYNEVAAGRPVLIGGGSMIGGGHSFVCDGADGNGFFHFNWGWTGMSDGYFSFDALNPYALGAGGGEGGGYNFTQDAVIGIQPPTGEPVVEEPAVLTQTGSLYAEVNDEGILAFALYVEQEAMWVNYNPETLHVMFGAKIEPMGDTPGTTHVLEISDKKFEVEPGYATGPAYFTPFCNISDLDLADGKYKVTIVQADPEDEEPVWLEVKTNRFYYNYVTLTVADGKYSVEVGDVYRLDVKGAKIIGDFYYGMSLELEITVGNDSDDELTSGFAPVFYYQNQIVMMGESVLITVKPHSQVTRTWTTPVYVMSQYFSPSEDIGVAMSFFDEMTYNVYTQDYYKRHVLKANPGIPTITTVGNPTIRDAEKHFMMIGGTRYSVYQVTDPRNIIVDCDVTLEDGAFFYPLLACVCSVSDPTVGGLEMMTYAGGPTRVAAGETQRFTANVAFPGAEMNKLYYLLMGYQYGSSFIQVAPGMALFKIVPSGIENVATDGESLLSYDGTAISAPGEYIEIYTLQGIKIAGGMETIPVSGYNAGIYIARAGGETLKFSVK